MKNLFFYGTLRHIPLLEIVIGRKISAKDVQAARLDGYRSIEVAKQPYPLLVSDPVGHVAGCVVYGMSGDDVARLDYYEGGFDFEIRAVEAHIAPEMACVAHADPMICPCEVYCPTHTPITEGPIWDFEGWIGQWAELSKVAAQEAMGYFGTLSPDELTARFGMIRARAAATVAARANDIAPRDDKMTAQNVEIMSQQVTHLGYFLTKTLVVRHPTYDGGRSAPLPREVFYAGDATIVLPYDPKRDEILLVEQFRMGPFARGDRHPWSLEPIAGRIDPGETAQQAAMRETREEAGIDLIALEKISAHYPTPGYSTEYFHCFLGLCDLAKGRAHFGGLDSEGEDIKTYILSFDQAMELLTTQAAQNGPLVLSLLWLAQNRPRLLASNSPAPTSPP